MRTRSMLAAITGHSGRFARTGRTTPAGSGGNGSGGQGDPGQPGSQQQGSQQQGGQGATPPAQQGGGQGGATPPAPPQQQHQQPAGQPGQQNGGQPATGDQPLGEGGIRALQAERDRATELQRQLTAVTGERDQLRSATQTEHERAVTTAREEGKAEVTQTMNRHLVAAKIEAAAATKGFHDPTDAVASLGERFGEITVTNGAPDAQQVTAMVEALATTKPHLVRQQQPAAPQHAGIPGHGTTQPTPSPPAATLQAGADAYKAWSGAAGNTPTTST